MEDDPCNAGSSHIARVIARLLASNRTELIEQTETLLGQVLAGRKSDRDAFFEIGKAGRFNIGTPERRRMEALFTAGVELTQGFRGWFGGIDELILDMYPAQEFFHLIKERESANWRTRWIDFGGEFYGGRMIAPKLSPVWTEVGFFGLPFPAFDFEDGMWVKEVGYEEAETLGLRIPQQDISRAVVDLDFEAAMTLRLSEFEGRIKRQDDMRDGNEA